MRSLFKVLQRVPLVFTDIKESIGIEHLYYVLSIQLDTPVDSLDGFLDCRRTILQCIIYLTLNTFF